MSRASPRFKRTNPPLPVVGTTQGVVLYRIFGRLEGQLTINTFYYLGPVNNPTQAQLTTLLANIHPQVFTNYFPCLSSDWGGNNVETLDVVHRNDIVGVQSLTSSGVIGGRTAGHLPTEVACNLIRYSAFKGQHGRGRIGLPGIATADVTASTITATTEITALNALATGMLATVSDGTNNWVPCIAQRGPVSPRLITNASAVVRVVVKTLLGTVRRRKVGRGK